MLLYLHVLLVLRIASWGGCVDFVFELHLMVVVCWDLRFGDALSLMFCGFVRWIYCPSSRFCVLGFIWFAFVGL